MYIDAETEPEPVTLAPSLRVALGAAAVLVMYIGIFPQRLIDLTQKAATSKGIEIQQGATKAAAPASSMSGEPDNEPPAPRR
jgi:hypothetical protein